MVSKNKLSCLGLLPIRRASLTRCELALLDISKVLSCLGTQRVDERIESSSIIRSLLFAVRLYWPNEHTSTSLFLVAFVFKHLSSNYIGESILPFRSQSLHT